MTRANLPARRENATRNVAWGAHAFTVTIGFDPTTGQPCEVFTDTAKGGDMQAALSDACIILSIAMQHGVTPAALGKSLGHVPGWAWDDATEAMVETLQPASPLGAVVAAVREEVRS